MPGNKRREEILREAMASRGLSGNPCEGMRLLADRIVALEQERDRLHAVARAAVVEQGKAATRAAAAEHERDRLEQESGVIILGDGLRVGRHWVALVVAERDRLRAMLEAFARDYSGPVADRSRAALRDAKE